MPNWLLKESTITLLIATHGPTLPFTRLINSPSLQQLILTRYGSCSEHTVRLGSILIGLTQLPS
jgi:hypothetical protein